MNNQDLTIHTISLPEDISEPILRQCYVLWNETRGGSIGPPNIDLLAVPEATDFTGIVLLKPDGNLDEATSGFIGQSFVRREKDQVPTGLPVSIFKKKYPNSYRMWEACYEAPRPIVLGPHDSAFGGHDYLSMVHICLPLSKDGATVDKLFYAAIFRRPDGTIA